mgnify:CR=1 FL=1
MPVKRERKREIADEFLIEYVERNVEKKGLLSVILEKTVCLFRDPKGDVLRFFDDFMVPAYRTRTGALLFPDVFVRIVVVPIFDDTGCIDGSVEGKSLVETVLVIETAVVRYKLVMKA